MAGMSNTLEQNLLDWYFRQATWDPGNPKIKLWEVTPTDLEAGTGGTETTGGNYTAGGKTATRGSTNWEVVTSTNGKALQNKLTTDFSWTANDANWGTVNGASLQSSADVFLWGGALTTPRTVGNGDTFRFAAGAISLKLDATTSAGITTLAKTRMLEHLGIGDQSANRVASTAYVALFTSATAMNLMDGSSATEVSGGGYARLAVTSSTIWHAAASVGTGYHIHNNVMNGWSAASADWGTIRYAALVKESAGAITEYYAIDQLASDVLVQNGDTFSIPADSWLISLDESN